MRILIMGSGGVGGLFGARLAKGGADVTFVVRGAHLAAMRKNGLRIEGAADPIVVDLGAASGVPTPLNRAVRDILILHAQGQKAT